MWDNLRYAAALIGFALLLYSEACDVRLESKYEHPDIWENNDLDRPLA